ncbi:MAG: adenylate kinase [Dehalococcoidales bacterium]|jgi:adenylate kinase|nr:adenylate kinase [Dehalococcoidales bacterium]MDD3264483.1 adenylate kinase [Dehalococcoidales bacterium]MDD4322014.1 adenylate kinase [Dehalococcoidales bacterium]MDD4793893.1 adenylate kinase [Dehalococcoidales bacterium]MDD5122073.1 adenylate kinase [Dehalococcoidales bacterium]
MYIIFMGPPGAGKGTQAERVAGELKLEHLAPGDLFRQAVKQESDLGNEVQGYMERGELVPDEITIRIILDKLDDIGDEKGVILDGFPRNYIQAVALDEALEKQNKAIDRVVNIQVEQKELVRRLSSRWLCRECQSPYSSSTADNPCLDGCPGCGGELYQRTDDKPETVARRLEVYYKETAPLIDYYRNQCKLVEVEGEGGVEEITARMIRALE